MQLCAELGPTSATQYGQLDGEAGLGMEAAEPAPLGDTPIQKGPSVIASVPSVHHPPAWTQRGAQDVSTAPQPHSGQRATGKEIPFLPAQDITFAS